MALTSGLRTVIRLGIEAKTMVSRGYHLRRDAHEIGRGRLPGAEKPHGIQKTGNGDAIILRERYSELAQLQKSENIGDVIGSADVNLGVLITARHTFRRNDDLSGASVDSGVAASGVTSFRKRAGDDWAAGSLAAGIPSPDPDADTTQTRPLDRIIEGKVSYPENCPFLLWLRLPANQDVGTDILCNFFFGGGASVLPEEATGGQFCLTVRGSGVGILQEWDGEGWQERQRIGLTPNQLQNDLRIYLTPYGRDRIWIRALDTLAATLAGTGMPGLLGTVAANAIRAEQYRKNGVPQALYIDDEGKTGHRHTRTATGAGVIMLDHRQVPRADVTIVRGKYVTTGTDTDGPFEIPLETPAGTPMRLELDTYTIPNSVVSGSLYSAVTHTELSVDDDGRYLVPEGERYFYLRYTLTSADNIQTPVVRGYTVDIEPTFSLQSGTPIVAPVHGTRVTGPDLEPDHETVSFGLVDRYGELSILRVQDRIRSTLSLVHPDTGVLISHLTEGETLQVHAKRRGRPDHLPSWHDYDARLVALWAKLKRQFYSGNVRSAYSDPNAPVDPGTLERDHEVAWKVSDWLTRMLLEAGVPPDEIDVPDSPLRFWGGNSEDITIQYGADLVEVISRLCRNYLGRILIRDPNAGERGMWRTLPNPRPPFTNVLFTLYLDDPGGFAGIHPRTRAQAFGSNTALIEAGTWDTWPEGPGVTHLTVEGIAADGGARLSRTVTLPGWDNPSSSNYTAGEIIPFTVGPESSLVTQDAVDWQARVLIDKAGARKGFTCRSALLLITDPQDTYQTRVRAPRINDLCRIVTNGGTYIGLLRSCEVDKTAGSDGFYHMEPTGYIVA